MAVLIPTMSTTIPHLSSHMTDTHGHSGSPGPPLSNHGSDLAITPTSKKPKLSLQTTSLSNTYGSLTRGLSINQQATYTPTTTNTCANTWDLSYRPSPTPRTESPRSSQFSRVPTQTQQERQPYTISLPFGVRPILKNSPLPPRATSISASPRDSKRKIFFPQPKKVIFRKNLEDVIHTSQYTAKHSDLSSSEDEHLSTSDNNTTTPIIPSEIRKPQHSLPSTRKRKDRRTSEIPTDTSSPDTQLLDQDIVDSRPLKSCKRRKWQWTLPSSEKLSVEDQSLHDQVDDTTFETQNDETEESDQTTTTTTTTNNSSRTEDDSTIPTNACTPSPGAQTTGNTQQITPKQ